MADHSAPSTSVEPPTGAHGDADDYYGTQHAAGYQHGSVDGGQQSTPTHEPTSPWDMTKLVQIIALHMKKQATNSVCACEDAPFPQSDLHFRYNTSHINFS